jgi:uncharacterized membrane protein YsdA (DUF1294 family)
MDYLIIALVIWNSLTFLLMGYDKYQAMHNQWRVPEKTLLTAAFAMGGLGCLAGSYVFRHKTRKTQFRILLPLAALLNMGLTALVLSGRLF